MSLADDWGDTGAAWTAEWRTLHLQLAEMSQLQIDTQLRVLKTLTLKLDTEETARDLERLQDDLVKLERTAEVYARKAADLRKAVGTFIAAVHSYRSTWQAPPEPSEWGTNTGIDDDVLERMANLYRRQGHYL